ncbi:hypothetical protein [Vreelandella andesensis]|uniref:hypothetical protein n=1 Tax=Vreelandella andesensis TaxID=447567 RepID=UPI00142D2AA2|nr:hypothetical protein [Halomonas andesensis]
MMLSIKQLAQLRAKGIFVRIEFANGVVKCSTPQGVTYYARNELERMAESTGVQV